MNLKLLLYFFIAFASLTQCAQEPEVKTLPRDKFISLLIRMHMVEADLSFHPKLDQTLVEKSYASYEKLFKQYGTDSTTVANTFEYYKDKQEELLDIYRHVLDSLNRMAEQSVPPPKKDSIANPVKDTLP